LIIVYSFPFSDKKAPMILLGKPNSKIADELKKDSSARKYSMKKGKVTLKDFSGTKKVQVQGGVPGGELKKALAQAGAAYDEVVENDDPVNLATVEGMDDDEPDTPKPSKGSKPSTTDDELTPTKAGDALDNLEQTASTLGVNVPPKT